MKTVIIVIAAASLFVLWQIVKFEHSIGMLEADSVKEWEEFQAALKDKK